VRARAPVRAGAADRRPAEFERLDLVDFRRAYLAQWPDEMPLDEWVVIGGDDWRGLGGHVKYAPLAGRPKFYDLSLAS
jgi:hypothetical protein